MSAITCIGGRNPKNKIVPICVDNAGNLSLGAVTIDTTGLASTDNIAAVTTAVGEVEVAVASVDDAVTALNTKIDDLTATVNALSCMRTTPVVKTSESNLLTTGDLSPGGASMIADISGMISAYIWYTDNMDLAAGMDSSKGLYVELSTDAYDSQTITWIRPMLQVLPALVGTYPSASGITRMVLVGPFQVAGFKSLRLVHQDPQSTDTATVFGEAKAKVICTAY